MVVLLSPSKNLHGDPKAAHRHTLPRMPEDSQKLISALKKLNPAAISGLMGISDNLSQLNYSRYRSFAWPHTTDNATVALYTFSGDVYQGLDAGTLTKAQIDFADRHVRILSGLYGLLRPLDLIQPYRLEMGVPLKTGRYGNLYEFWGSRITSLLAEDVRAGKAKAVINLASQEYAHAVDPAGLPVPVIEIQFLEERNGKLKFISFNAKRSRGWMARFIIDHKIKSVEDLKAFDTEGYAWQEKLSAPDKMVFVR